MIVTQNKIVFQGEDFKDLMPHWGTSNISNQKGTGLAAMRSMNPFRNYGYATPGYNPTDVTQVAQVTTLLRNGVVNGNYAYIISNGSTIQKFDLTTGAINTTGWPYTVNPHAAHSSVVLNDCCVYTAKVGGTSASRMFYSWSDNTDWDVGVFDFSSTTDDDFMSTAPATPLADNYGGVSTADFLTQGVGYPHPLIVGDDDILYIGDRNFIHAYDGQNAADNDGKFFGAVLTLPKGYVITSFSKIESGLMVFTYLENSVGSGSYYLGSARAWEWNYSDLDITRSHDLNDNYVTESFNYKGTIGCFTSGRPNDLSISKLSKLQFFNGSTFEGVASFPTNPPIRGGVDIVGDAIYWNSDGIIYCYGSPLLGVKAGLNKVGEGTGTSSGLLKSFTSTAQYASTGTTTSGGLQNVSADYYYQTSFATGLAQPIFGITEKGKIKNVKVRFAQTCSGGRNIVIQLRDRYTGSSDVISTSESFTAVTGQDGMVLTRSMDAAGSSFISFDALKLIVSWGEGSGATDAPILESVEVEFIPIKT